MDYPVKIDFYKGVVYTEGVSKSLKFLKILHILILKIN